MLWILIFFLKMVPPTTETLSLFLSIFVICFYLQDRFAIFKKNYVLFLSTFHLISSWDLPKACYSQFEHILKIFGVSFNYFTKISLGEM